MLTSKRFVRPEDMPVESPWYFYMWYSFYTWEYRR